MSLATQLRKARQAKGLSQQFIADKLGVKHWAISNLETGRFKGDPQVYDAALNIISNASHQAPNKQLRGQATKTRNKKNQAKTRISVDSKPSKSYKQPATGEFLKFTSSHDNTMKLTIGQAVLEISASVENIQMLLTALTANNKE